MTGERQMTGEQQIRETVAGCVGVMALYAGSGRTRWAKEAMVAEVRAIAGLVGRWGLASEATEDKILMPVEYALLDRYGREAGRRLHTEFVRVFEDWPGPDPIPDPP